MYSYDMDNFFGIVAKKNVPNPLVFADLSNKAQICHTFYTSKLKTKT